MTTEAWIGIGQLVLTAFLAIGGIVVLLLRRNADGTSERVEKHSDKQATHGETQAALSARVDVIEDAMAKVADAMQRIARLEEWRLGVSPRIDEADLTSKAVIALGEQNKSIFKRMDATDRKIDEQSAKIDALPRETAEYLRGLIRPVETRRAS